MKKAIVLAALLIDCQLHPAGDPDFPGAVLAWFTDQTAFTQAPRTTTGARLVRAIGHDLGNMMMVIQGFAEMLARELPEGSRARGWMSQIRTASDRAVALGEELLAVSRQPDPGLEDLAPAAVLGALQPLVQRLVGPGIQVDLRAPDGDRSLRTNRDQFESVLLSLVALERVDRPKDACLHIEASWIDGPPPMLVLRVAGTDLARAWEVRLPSAAAGSPGMPSRIPSV